ncbi:MAG TPA: prephenate dehydratase domain-containing protein, partial [Anaerolinea sp.]|nr:prephenate dehydratase domain-containing protein [Anaerolinea sp.]
MLIAFQGEHGAYSEAGIFEHFGAQVGSLPCASSDMVFASVASGAAEMGFIPIENSLAGSIHRNYDLLLQNQLVVVGEHNLRVSHCLIGLPGARLEDIRTVISHPQALAQCAGFIRRHKFEAVTDFDTAGAAMLLAQAWGNLLDNAVK